MSSNFRIHFFVNSHFTKIVSVVVLFFILSLEACSETKNNEKKPEKQHPIAGLVIEPAQENGVFYQLDNLATAIKAGKREHKRVLIYFTGWACVNARRVENAILADSQVQAALNENYLCFSAYVDDKIDGKKNAKLQMDYFKSRDQPHFYVLDENGIIVSDIQHAITPAEFETFLDKGLK